MICLLEKELFELKNENIVDGVLTMTWGEYRLKKFGDKPAVTQVLVNNFSGAYNYGFSDSIVTADTIFTIQGLPEVIQSIQITVI